jgi:hypothetical protein
MESTLKYFFNLIYLIIVGWLIYCDYAFAWAIPFLFLIFINTVHIKLRYISEYVVLFSSIGSLLLGIVKFFVQAGIFALIKREIATLLKYNNFEISDSLGILISSLLIFTWILLFSVFIFAIINLIKEIFDHYKFFEVNINEDNPKVIFIKNLFEELSDFGILSFLRLSFAYLLVSFLLVTSHFIISVNILNNEFFKFDLLLFTIELTNFQLKFLFNTALIIIAYFKYKFIIELLKS